MQHGSYRRAICLFLVVILVGCVMDGPPGPAKKKPKNKGKKPAQASGAPRGPSGPFGTGPFDNRFGRGDGHTGPAPSFICNQAVEPPFNARFDGQPFGQPQPNPQTSFAGMFAEVPTRSGPIGAPNGTTTIFDLSHGGPGGLRAQSTGSRIPEPQTMIFDSNPQFLPRQDAELARFGITQEDVVDTVRHSPPGMAFSVGQRVGDGPTTQVHMFTTGAMTTVHETTHAINAWLECWKNFQNQNGRHERAFYAMDGKAYFVQELEPEIGRGQVSALLPITLQGMDQDGRGRHATYFLDGGVGHNSMLYLWDEWFAYTNGARAAIQQARHGRSTELGVDAMAGPLEFTVYALATLRAAKDHHPPYGGFPQMEAVFKANAERAMGLVREGIEMSTGLNISNGSRSAPSHPGLFSSDKELHYLQRFRGGGDLQTEALRKFAIDEFGPVWTQRVFGFGGPT
jgi:hypothetical protein